MRKTAWILCTVTVLCTISLLAFTVRQIYTTPQTISEVAYDDYRKQALEMVRAESGNLFNLSTALLAALWAALIIPKETRLDLRDIPNIFLFSSANLLLAGSLLFNLRYSRLISRLYWDMGPLLSTKQKFADVMNTPWIALHQNLAVAYFFAGLVVAGVLLLSAIYFRRQI